MKHPVATGTSCRRAQHQRKDANFVMEGTMNRANKNGQTIGTINNGLGGKEETIIIDGQAWLN
jgi:hypothetical protein